MKSYINSVQKQFLYYKTMTESAIAQLTDEQLFESLSAVSYSNSIAIIMKHMQGNMLSRWTNFFKEDGEKEWRKRDEEFISDINDREELLKKWNEGWSVLFSVIDNLTSEDLSRIIYIRNMGHTVVEAINRQMMHYAYHIGQIVLIAKEFKGDEWKSLSIPLGESQTYNSEKFSAEKEIKHFTDENN